MLRTVCQSIFMSMPSLPMPPSLPSLLATIHYPYSIRPIKKLLLLTSVIGVLPFLWSYYSFQRFLNQEEICFLEPRPSHPPHLPHPSFGDGIVHVDGHNDVTDIRGGHGTTTAMATATMGGIDASICRPISGSRWICSNTNTNANSKCTTSTRSNIQSTSLASASTEDLVNTNDWWNLLSASWWRTNHANANAAGEDGSMGASSCSNGIGYESAVALDAHVWKLMNDNHGRRNSRRRHRSHAPIIVDTWRLEYDEALSNWCFISSLVQDNAQEVPVWCATTGSTNDASSTSVVLGGGDGSDILPKVPPSGTWTLQDKMSNQDTTNQNTSTKININMKNTDIDIAIQCYSKRYTSTLQQQQPHFHLWNLWPRRTYKIENVRRNPNASSTNRPKTPQFLTDVMDHPTTHILMGLLGTIYILYKQYETCPSSVAKRYESITSHPFEIWRCITGAMSHFEPFHLGMNCMALYSLGMELEGHHKLYSSVEFGLYNFSLIIWTGGMFCILIYIKMELYRRYYRYMGTRTGRMEEYRLHSSGMEEQIRQTSAVGYSGVLFAWMVVASLEQERTCPIPFLPKVCFETHSWNMWGMLGGDGDGDDDDGTSSLLFNMGPLVQLVVAQVILPRVSFVGHLSGILCGFILHWRILPSEIFSCPHVLIPLVLLIHWKFVRGIIPVSSQHRSNSTNANANTNINTARWSLDQDYAEEVEQQDESSSFRNNKKRDLSDSIRKAQLVLSFTSVLVLSWKSSIVIAQVLSFLIFHYAVQSSKHFELKSLPLRNSEQAGILLRGSFVSLLLLLISDFITVPRWITLRFYIRAQQPNALNFSALISVMMMRCTINGFAFALTCGKLNDLEQVGGGLFRSSFGWIISAGASLVAIMTSKRPNVPFQGQGFLLGRQ